jgi:hypothetical protein
MSNLLERMIQRTRAPLAGIDPLVQPRYSQLRGQSPLAMSATSDAASEAATGTMEQSTASQISPPAGSRERPMPEIPASMDRVQRAASARASVTDTARRDSGESLSVPLEARRSTSTDDAGKREARGEDRARSQISPVPENAETSNAAASTANERLVAAARMQQNLAATRSPAEKGFSSQPRREPYTETESVKDGANVIISIGHIEVRAAQAAERPRRPAFRPRVSLDEFLGRKNGARS